MQDSPVLCHSDLVHASIALGIRNFQNPCGELLNSLKNFGVGQNFWFPAFNMDFGQSRLFDLEKSPSQVGVLGEFVRTSPGSWRTAVPFYSITGFQQRPSTEQLGTVSFNLWGKGSVFEDVYLNNGKILFLGADFSTFTYIHFVESYSGAPVYRYSKSFSGSVSHNGNTSDVKVEMHVRPPGDIVKYDWNKIFQDLLDQNLVSFYSASQTIFSIDSRNLTDFLVKKISLDPLYLLEPISRQLVQKKLTGLGRSFSIGDFESE